MLFDMKAYIESLKINECNQCEEIKLLQSLNSKNIKVAPLFWQGEGKLNIPLIIMGINPSVVGTTDEPRRGGDFEQYYDYYQNRHESEKKNVSEARDGGFLRRIPTNYWTRCHNLAKCLVGNHVERWKDYVLIEAIHCFYNKASDLSAEQSIRVAEKCFDRHTKNLIITLKPKMIVLFGKSPYQLLAKYLNEALVDYEYTLLNVDNFSVPVLRHPHPASFNSGTFYRPDIYESFKLFCKKVSP
jgi:hypothetical protein